MSMRVIDGTNFYVFSQKKNVVATVK